MPKPIKKGPERLRCNSCGKCFTFLQELKHHKVNAHDLHCCDLHQTCCFTCKDIEDLKKHWGTGHLVKSSQIPDYERDYNQRMGNPPKKQLEVPIVVKPNQQNIMKKETWHVNACRACKMLFPNEILLDNHILQAHAKVMSKFELICNHCFMTYSDVWNLKIHLSKSQNNGDFSKTKSFICSYKWCDFSSLDVYLVESHLNQIHKPKGGLQCGKCKKNFNSKMYFDLHIGYIHKQKPKTDEEQKSETETSDSAKEQLEKKIKVEPNVEIKANLEPFDLNQPVKTNNKDIKTTLKVEPIDESFRFSPDDFCFDSDTIKTEIKEEIKVEPLD